MIKIENAIKNYKVGQTQVHACNGIRLEIPDGAFVSVSGRSGSGKTTLLNLIAGKEKPDSGKVLIDGVDIHKLPDRQLL